VSLYVNHFQLVQSLPPARPRPARPPSTWLRQGIAWGDVLRSCADPLETDNCGLHSPQAQEDPW